MNDFTDSDFEDAVFVHSETRRIDAPERECTGACISMDKARGYSSLVDSHSFRCANCDSGSVCHGCQRTKVAQPMQLCPLCQVREDAELSAMGDY